MYTNLPERVFSGCGVQTKGNEQFALRTGRKRLVFSFLQAKEIYFASAPNEQSLFEVDDSDLFQAK